MNGYQILTKMNTNSPAEIYFLSHMADIRRTDYGFCFLTFDCVELSSSSSSSVSSWNDWIKSTICWFGPRTAPIAPQKDSRQIRLDHFIAPTTGCSTEQTRLTILNNNDQYVGLFLFQLALNPFYISIKLIQVHFHFSHLTQFWVFGHQQSHKMT